jgi:phytoene/squalene synthetase
MNVIHEYEKSESRNIDEVAGVFGEIMAEIFAYRQDEWEETLRRMGFFFGKFIYLMDAYEDIENDMEKGTYNPLKDIYQKDDFEELAGQVLLMMMAECSKAFERLPIVENAQILRNILYSGVWSKYDLVKQKRKEQKES